MKVKKGYKFYIIIGILMFCMVFGIANVVTTNNNISTVAAASSCNHPYYVRYGTGTFVKEYYDDSAKYCYKTSYWYKQRCGKCKYKISQRSYDAWEKHKHDYGFLSLRKTCKECGHKK